MNRSIREGKSVKRVERSNGLDTALYTNYLYLYINSLNTTNKLPPGYQFCTVDCDLESFGGTRLTHSGELHAWCGNNEGRRSN